MLKRNIAILIAGGLLSVQAGLAGAQTTASPSGDEAPFALLPAQSKYFAERAAANPNPTGATGSPVSSFASGGATLPAQAQYLAERAALIANDRTVVRDHNADGHMTNTSD